MHVGDAERRARLIARHHLGGTARDVADAVRGVVAMHSSDPITPHLGLRARVREFETTDLDRALTQKKSLWRLHGMRATLFVVSAEDAPTVLAATAREIAKKERRRLEGWVAKEIRAKSVRRWIAKVEDRVLEHLADGKEHGTRDLSAAIPDLTTQITLGSGKWATRAPVGSRLLLVLAMEGRIVRTRTSGSWRTSQYRWALAERWFGRTLAEMDPADARAELVRRYLESHGPATRTDVRWWTGLSAKHVDAALLDIAARRVGLDRGGEGFVAAGDEGGPRRPQPHVAFLPGLDSTPMGWKERDWFLGPHAKALFDTNGNVGPTVWLDGRIVGGWAQRADGEVVSRLLEDVSKRNAARIAKEAASLTEWMDGVVAIPRFRTPLERELSAR